MKNIKKLICLLVLSFFINGSYAQQVQELGSKLSAMRASQDVANKNEADQLSSLVYDSKPTLYCEGGQLIKIGEQIPLRLVTDASSLQLLSTSNTLYNSVELITVKIENQTELNRVLKLADLTTFTKLKYICFQFAFQICPDQTSACEIGKISKMIQDNGSSAFKVLYTINIDN